MLSPDDVLPALDRWVDVFDEPFGDQAALPTMLLAQYARREVTVVLTGEGADEVFGGYSNYVKRLSEERLTRVLGARGSPLPVARPPAAAARLRATASSRRRPSRARGATRRFRTFSIRCCAANISRRHSPPQRTRANRRRRRSASTTTAIRPSISTICSTSTPGCGCPTTSSRKSTARRWRSRSKRACRISTTSSTAGARGSPPSLKVRGNERKRILKSLAERYLPRDIVHREKQGFMMPLERWLAHELRADVAQALGPHGFARRGLMRPGGDRAARRRACVGPEEPRDAPLGAADPRALARALRTGFRVAMSAAGPSQGANRSPSGAAQRPNASLRPQAWGHHERRRGPTGHRGRKRGARTRASRSSIPRTPAAGAARRSAS